MRPAAVVAGILVLGACGREEPTAPGVSATELRVTLWPDGRSGRAVVATLACDPPAGNHPRAAAACRALSENVDALDPVPADAICTQLFGGPEEAEIEGTLEGRAVRASFNKRNGCEIARWERLGSVLSLERR